ncbi:MAG: aerobic-type carbon monoxide dehydrogenase small subunit (CoxS/CutS family), partial [Alphaproteobacteria bacterium]
MANFTLSVNGAAHEIDVDPTTPLIFVLRNQLGLTGPKLGCALEQCGACTVLVDGEATQCCVRAVSEFE